MFDYAFYELKINEKDIDEPAGGTMRRFYSHFDESLDEIKMGEE